MKRLLYSLPLFALLLPWMFISFVVLVIGLFVNHFSLLLIIPVAAVMWAAFRVHRVHSAREQHGIAALGAATVLAAPLIAILVGFACHSDAVFKRAGMQGAVDQAVEHVSPPRHEVHF